MVVDNSDIGHGDFERIACIVFLCVTPTFLIARFLSRILSKQVGIDDWSALAAFVFVLNCNCVTLAAFQFGWGRHKKNLSAENLRICLILHWIFQITYKMAVCMNKFSILLLYLRIMPQRYYRIIIYSLLTVIGLFAFATTIAGIFQCIPVYKAWNKAIPGHCYNLVNAWYTNAVFSIITDILILTLPMYMTYKLQRDKREKLLLYGVFGLGIFVTFTSVMRFFELKSAKNPDTTYDINSGYWSVIEINVGVICVCLPPLHSLLARHLRFLSSRRTRVTAGSDGPYQNHSSSKNNAELVTIGGGNGTGGGRKVNKKPVVDTMDGSEEELVLERGEFVGDVKAGERGMVIHKTTEFEVSERSIGGEERGNRRMKPWEGIEGARR